MRIFAWVSVAIAGLVIVGCHSPTEPTRPTVGPVPSVVPPPVPPAPPPAPSGTAVFVPAPTDAGASPFGEVSAVGLYRLDLTLGDTTDPDCAFIPDDARTRTYAAAVTFAPFVGLRLKLGDATFLEAASCDHPPAGSGDRICHWLTYEYDDFRDGYLWLGAYPTPLVERLSDGSWLEIRGSSYGPETPTGVTGTGPVTVLFWPGEATGGEFRECHAPSARTTLVRR